MKFKKFKYNIICLFSVLLIASAVVLKVTFVDPQVPDTQLSVEIPQQDPQGNTDNAQDETEEVVEMKKYEKDKNLPSTRTPITLLNYCIEKIAACDSYKTEFSYTSRFAVTIAQSKLRAVQQKDGYTIKSGAKRYEYATMSADDTARKYAGGIAQDGVEVRYYDGAQGFHEWQSHDGIYDPAQAPYTKYNSLEELDLYYDFLYPTPIFTTSGTSASAKVDPSKGTIVLTITMSNKDDFPASFLRQYKSFTKNLSIYKFEQSVVFTIDSNSGYILNFSKKDKLEGTHASFKGVPISMELTYTSKFSKFNEQLDIKIPPIPEQEEKSA